MCDYIDNVVQQLMDYGVNKDTIVKKFCKKFKLLNNKMSETHILDTAYKLVGKRLAHENLSIRKKAVGKLLKAIRKIREQPVDDSIFEQGSHTKSSEPFFAEIVYKALAASEETVVDRINRHVLKLKKVTFDERVKVNVIDIVIGIDGNAVCHLSFDDEVDENSSWPCSILCKEWTEEQKKALIQLKDCFEDSIDMLRPLLECLDDGCG